MDTVINADQKIEWYITTKYGNEPIRLAEWERTFGVHEDGTIFVPVIVRLDQAIDFNIRIDLYTLNKPCVFDEDGHIFVPIDYIRRKARHMTDNKRRKLNDAMDVIETLASGVMCESTLKKSGIERQLH